MNSIIDIVKDNILTYEQKLIALARAGENTLNVLKIDEETQTYREEGIICDLFEGNAPYRPRYIAPDYQKFMKEGSEFLELPPPKNLWEAIHSLLILYRHVPSITSFPVYLGNIDELLDPYIEDEDEAYQAIKLFLKHIDRTITDSFCHANIGPKETKAGRLILRAEQELKNATPNITLKYSDETTDDFAIEAIKTSLITAKPSFANDSIFHNDFQGNYAIVSCYNGLPIGGGSHTLVRLNLAKLVTKANTIEEFLEDILPYAVEKMTAYMTERIRFLVEESNFFQTNFLVKEGLIHLDRFTAMFGMVGLAECVNHLLGAKEQKNRFGYSQRANELGHTIVKKLQAEVNKHKDRYCQGSEGVFLLHAQVGIDTDGEISPGCRIPIGEEPPLWEHLNQAATFHSYFPSGIGDIFPFESTVKNNPHFLLDIIRGAFEKGMRYISFYGSDSDIIRITGYLVKKSEMEKLQKGYSVLQDTVVLGLGCLQNQKILERKIRENE